MELPVRFLDLRVTDENERRELHDAFEGHLSSGNLILSDDGSEFESQFAASVGRGQCVGVNCGTDALLLGVRMLNLPNGGHVITSPFSWIASSTAIALNHLQPRFVDIDENLQLNLDEVERELTENSAKPVAILVPHLHGNVVDLSRLSSLRAKFGVKIIEDCAQAYGARDSAGRLAGTIGDISAFSFNPMKVLGALGDAGAIVFDDSRLVSRAKSLRHSGLAKSNSSLTELSHNCRLDALQASLLMVRLKYLNAKIARRREIFSMYQDAFSGLLRSVTLSGFSSNHYCYQTISDCRDDLKKWLEDRGVEVRIRHDFLIPDHPVFHGVDSRIPLARSLVSKTLCLPMHENLSDEQIAHVVSVTKSFFE